MIMIKIEMSYGYYLLTKLNNVFDMKYVVTHNNIDHDINLLPLDNA